ncbi:MAG: phage holin family protein [Actinomycetota bacterium]|nr:phage holin family protein [Actinomycetota bacterium]
MIRWILQWAILTFSITVASYFLPFIYISGDTNWDRIKIAFIAGLLLGLCNVVIKPIVKILSIPINILTLGLFNIVINAGMLWIVDLAVRGLEVNGFWGYVLSSIVISIISIVISKLIFFKEKKGEKG